MNIKKDSAGYVSKEYIISKGFWIFDTISGNDMGQMEWSMPQYTNGKLKILGGYWEWCIRDENDKELFRGWWNTNEEFDATLEEISKPRITGEQQKLPCFQCWLEIDKKDLVEGNLIYQENIGWLHFCPEHNKSIIESENPTSVISKLIEKAKAKQEGGIEYEVWTEGFSATGEHSGAMFHGKTKATSFDEACIKLLGNSLDKDDKQPDGYRRSRIGTYSVWACACFSNELDARKSFG